MKRAPNFKIDAPGAVVLVIVGLVLLACLL
jgi:hypothetical protein